MRLYVAGPMRGIPLYNFPAFDVATAHLRSLGHEVVSPAEMDRDLGFDPRGGALPAGFIADAMRRDLAALVDLAEHPGPSGAGIVLLDGWRRSRGALLERQAAEAMGLALFELSNGGSLQPLGTESVLEEAQRLVGGDRGEDYGHPADDFGRTGRMWGAVLDEWRRTDEAAVPARLVALCMVAVKMSREVTRPKRDNRVDGPGYFLCLDMVEDREART